VDVNFAFLCDAAELGQHGKISALGIGIQNFYIADLDQPGPPFVFVCHLAGSSTEVGTKKAAVHLIDADGNELVPPMQCELNVAKPNAGNRWGTGLLMQYNGVKYPRYGAYAVSMVVDGHELVNLPFTVAPPPSRTA